MNRLLTLPYIEKFGGVVQTIQKVIPQEGNKSIVKRIPVSQVHQDQPCSLIDMEKETIQFLPESKLKGMLYFEDNGISLDTSKRSTSMNFYRSRMRLIVWLNQKLISPKFDIGLSSIAMNEIISMLGVSYGSSEIFKNMNVIVTNVPPANASLFSEYDYNEKETQFLMPPFDFFGIDLEIRFGISKGCKIVFTPTDGYKC